jgi:hypothetical protein
MRRRDLTADEWAGFADGLMAAGDRLAEKLADVDDSDWTQQILEEWKDAQDLGERTTL